MSRTKTIALSILGIVIPMALAFTAYLISRNTIGAAGTVPSLTHVPAQSVSPTGTPSSSGEPKPARTGGKQGSGSGSGQTSNPGTSTPEPTATSTDDHGGKCSEPEHINDPSCDSGSSGSGSGSGGSGSNSGHGGGDD